MQQKNILVALACVGLIVGKAGRLRADNLINVSDLPGPKAHSHKKSHKKKARPVEKVKPAEEDDGGVLHLTNDDLPKDRQRFVPYSAPTSAPPAQNVSPGSEMPGRTTNPISPQPGSPASGGAPGYPPSQPNTAPPPVQVPNP